MRAFKQYNYRSQFITKIKVIIYIRYRGNKRNILSTICLLML